jgi:hypothetical protein
MFSPNMLPPASAPFPIAKAFGPAGAIARSLSDIRSLILSVLVLNLASSANCLKTCRCLGTFWIAFLSSDALMTYFEQAKRDNISSFASNLTFHFFLKFVLKIMK